MSIHEERQRMMDVLKDTVSFYRADPTLRATDINGDCCYTLEDADGSKRHCAFGRYMRPEYQTVDFEENFNIGITQLDKEIDCYLRSDVLGFSEVFWKCIQDMHDNCTNWKPDGLSDMGKGEFMVFQDRIMKGQFDNE